MDTIKNYQEWKNKVDYLANELLKRESLINQYSIWLETSEEHTNHKGEDVYNMVFGALQAIDGTPNFIPDVFSNFIPGTGLENFVAVISKIQEKSGLNLGVCQFLSSNIENSKRFEYGEGPSKENMPECRAKEGLLIGSLKMCVPPERSKCPYRIRKLEEVSSS